MPSNLRSFAFGCKIIAIVMWILMFWSQVIFHLGPIDYVRLLAYLVVTLLALMPNRWLVSLPIVFFASFVIAIIPWGHLIYNVTMELAFAVESPHPVLGVSIILAVAIIYSVIVFLPLPCSLLFSFWRARKGEQVTYA